ncbi:hypothetical protein CASFOL_002466 [Castilleja foliolosa]|uniref:BRX domain-containing protein n=1 Tax=Castilleja foliolosa TaxID=1961234 RepID=A0ABD3EED2_9LAMI
MLTCIKCSKQRAEEDAPRGTPNTKAAVKSSADSRFPSFTGDRTASGLEYISAQSGEGPKEWTAQVEPGVQITFISLSRLGNDLKRIRFSREMFNKWQAQRWWGQNYDRIVELYNVQRFSQQAPNITGKTEDGRDSTYSRESPRYKPTEGNLGNQNYGSGSRTRTEASVSVSNESEIELEWIEEDEDGVYITIRQLVDGTRELRRVRFSREKFGEVRAKLWWETNRDRIQTQYLCL